MFKDKEKKHSMTSYREKRSTMFLHIMKIAKQKMFFKTIFMITCPFVLMLPNGNCNRIENLELFDNIIAKDILVGKGVYQNMFESETIEEQNIRSYIFDFKFKKKDPIQHYICTVSVARAGVYIDPKQYKAEYNRLKNEYMKNNHDQWMKQLRLDFPGIGRRAQYGHIAAGPGGTAYDLSITTSDGLYDIKVLISNLMPETVKGPDLDIEQIALAISNRYDIAVNHK